MLDGLRTVELHHLQSQPSQRETRVKAEQNTFLHKLFYLKDDPKTRLTAAALAFLLSLGIRPRPIGQPSNRNVNISPCALSYTAPHTEADFFACWSSSIPSWPSSKSARIYMKMHEGLGRWAVRATRCWSAELEMCRTSWHRSESIEQGCFGSRT